MKLYGIGRWYRIKMRLAHRLGYCYPQSVDVEPRQMWCRWCGLRGKR